MPPAIIHFRHVLNLVRILLPSYCEARAAKPRPESGRAVPTWPLTGHCRRLHALLRGRGCGLLLSQYWRAFGAINYTGKGPGTGGNRMNKKAKKTVLESTEERLVGTEWGSSCCSRWVPDEYKKKKNPEHKRHITSKP